MRLPVAILVVAGVLAASAGATGVEPRLLVLRSADVPPGFVADPQGTGVRTNEGEAGSNRSSRALIARLGRVTGYEAEWKREPRQETIISRADVFRAPAGAREFVALSATTFRRSGIKGLRRSPLRIGAGGHVFHGGSGGDVAWVLWRSRNVAGTVLGWGIPRAATIALARAQQRRIALATR